MKVVVSGGSGFIGSVLCGQLAVRGHEVVIVDRNPPRSRRDSVTFIQADLMKSAPAVFGKAEGIIHLSGANIFARWTEDYKKLIRASRTASIGAIARVIEKAPARPRVFVCASAVGYYGDRGEEALPESAAPGKDFLASVCMDWEKAAERMELLGLRRVSVRTAIVLGPGGGTLGKLVPLYRWGLGGRMGSGTQWFSWVHLKDLVEIYIAAIENDRLSGPVNAAAPGPVRNLSFARSLGQALRRPAIIPAPAWALRLGLGEFATAILSSQKVVPQKLSEIGFAFAYPGLDEALADIFSSKA